MEARSALIMTWKNRSETFQTYLKSMPDLNADLMTNDVKFLDALYQSLLRFPKTSPDWVGKNNVQYLLIQNNNIKKARSTCMYGNETKAEHLIMSSTSEHTIQRNLIFFCLLIRLKNLTTGT